MIVQRAVAPAQTNGEKSKPPQPTDAEPLFFVSVRTVVRNSTASDTSRNQLAAATENATLPKAPARVAAAKRSAIPARPVVTLSIKLMQPSRSVARLFPQRGSQTPDVQPRTDEPDGHRP